MRVAAAIALLMAPTGAWGAETVTYTYDALGRLVRSSVTRPSGNVDMATGFDPAGNRTGHVLGPPGTQPPAPPNDPPVANPDNAGTMLVCTSKTVNVTANDTDPDGDLPLTVQSATASGDINASVASATSVTIESGESTGAKSISYTIADSRGATASSYISVTVQAGVCQ